MTRVDPTGGPATYVPPAQVPYGQGSSNTPGAPGMPGPVRRRPLRPLWPGSQAHASPEAPNPYGQLLNPPSRPPYAPPTGGMGAGVYGPMGTGGSLPTGGFMGGQPRSPGAPPIARGPVTYAQPDSPTYGQRIYGDPWQGVR